jgi:hypothetical protein
VLIPSKSRLKRLPGYCRQPQATSSIAALISFLITLVYCGVQVPEKVVLAWMRA